MSKEITKSVILQEIQDKFQMRDFDPARFLFDETVIPVYEISEHLRFFTADHAVVLITGAPAGIIFFTIPADEKWTLLAYNLVFGATGAHSASGVYINRKNRVTAGTVTYLDLKAGQDVSYAVNLPKEVILTPGDTLCVYIDSYTSDQNLRLYIDYIMEKIR